MDEGDELFARFMDLVENGEHPVIDVDKFNVVAYGEGEDRPSIFLVSFAGVDQRTTKEHSVHVKLNSLQLAQLMEQFRNSAIAELDYAINGVSTRVLNDGTVEFIKRTQDGD